jgi:CubicO group peptidase (beta-lactamase class C family)
MKILRSILLLAALAAIAYGLVYAWRAAPILTGYGAKMLCSCAFAGGREADDVINIELARFPVSLGSYQLDREDSSATGSVMGLARKKAIFRSGLGCTLANGISEAALRSQPITRYVPLPANPDTIPWPMGDRLPDSIPPGVAMRRLHEVVEGAFAGSENDSRNTRAILVVYDDAIVAEKYAEGFDRRSRHMGWSMTKSVINALTGILVRQGRLNIHEPAPISFWREDERADITINHLLQASSGLEWVEDYSGPSDATNIFKKKDTGLYAAHQSLRHPPGTVFYYSSGATNLISWIIRQTIGDDDYYAFPQRELFEKIGITSMILEPDAGGTFVGSSFSFASARDWARLGMLYLHGGMAGGERILSEDWVKYSTTPAPAAHEGEYGAQFWLNAGSPQNASDRIFPDVPPDLFFADGFAGQNVFILPSKKLVVVKLSESQGDYLDDNRFLGDIIATLPD